jgi:transaldolase/glucose-6-phosphate isomerase
MKNPLIEVIKFGQSIWYDGLISREEFDRMIVQDGLRGATTNPVIFEKALASGKVAGRVRELGKRLSDEEIYRALAVEAVQEVADVFLPVYQKTLGFDGYVSIEVSPLLAYDTEATLREARELFQKVNRPNVMIKIPATAAGIAAVQTAISEGINVNITLIFSVARYCQVMEAYLAGLEIRSGRGQSIKEVASVASFFVSRVDTAVDKILGEKIAGAKDSAQQALFRQLLGKAAIANSKVAYAEFEQVFTNERFRVLKSRGAQVQRPLWASTGTKNPAYRDVLYVESLIGPNTVNTVPPPTLDAFRDHGEVSETLIEGLDEAKKCLEKLTFAGVVLSAVTEELEKSGVTLFSEAYHKIIKLIQESRMDEKIVN